MIEMNLKPLDVAADEIVYSFEEADVLVAHSPYPIIHLEAEARGCRYDLYIVHDERTDSVVITLANFGRAIKLKMSSYHLSWDYVADKLELRKVDAQIATHMINRAFVLLGLTGETH